jgi:hypothetical protein
MVRRGYVKMATVAVSRNLAIIMHRMRLDDTKFPWKGAVEKRWGKCQHPRDAGVAELAFTRIWG